MKPLTIFLICGVIALCALAQSGEFNLSTVDVYTVDGERINVSELAVSNQPTLMLFWKLNDRQSFEQLILLNDFYKEYLKEKKVKAIGICTDVDGAELTVKSLINGNGIEIEIYIDRNNDLKRAMEISILPTTFLFDDYPAVYSSYVGYYPHITELIHGWIEKFIARRK